MSVLGDRLQRYREFAPAMTEKERAEEEAQLWALVPAAERPKEGRGAWLAANCGGSSFTYENRCTLYMAGAVADPLWARVDADMTLNTAVTLLREARNDGRGRFGPAGVAEVLARYDALPNMKTYGDGKVVRRKGYVRTVVAPPGQPKRHIASSFWAAVRSQLGAYVSEQLQDVPPQLADKLAADFERDLSSLLEEYQDKIRAAVRRAKPARATRRQVLDACGVLCLDPPGPGEPVDLAVARRHQRRQARVYHPDVGGDETRADYEKVMKAYATLESYTEELGKPALRVVNGGKDGSGADNDD